MDWREVAGNWLWIPPNPKAIIHFLGGAFVGAAPHLTYRWLLEQLGRQGYAIVATPFVNTFDHRAIAKEVLTTFDQGMYYLRSQVLVSDPYLPIYGLGHSMGCKIHLLMNSLWELERDGNILMAFNNYPARRSIPLLEQAAQFNPIFNVEFSPSPEATLDLIADTYHVRRNLLVKFRSDNIDQTRSLSHVLVPKFPELTTIRILKGNHNTPAAQDVDWQPGTSFSAIDAVGQFVRQEFLRDIKALKQELLLWLDPLCLTSG